MANKILIIGVGSSGVVVADKINLPNSKKLFIDSGSYSMKDVKSDGEKLELVCKDFGVCSGFCHCYNRPDFSEKVALDYEDGIRECIKNAFTEHDDEENY